METWCKPTQLCGTQFWKGNAVNPGLQKRVRLRIPSTQQRKGIICDKVKVEAESKAFENQNLTHERRPSESLYI
ncbi:hypothetical protein N656DRAFT_776815 [Canariomyces notabilis]|uniref:Uncharacterized protein n=1 Tax=Canariomyces notabilis TaxID=2074819 RepID=A0AAN6TIR4_9PEZI|nr:hypothetical protein N656DRAFT_776815 [Canariomyces arenarius]